MTNWQTYNPSLIKFESLVAPGNPKPCLSIKNSRNIRPLPKTVNSMYQLLILHDDYDYYIIGESKLLYVWLNGGNTSHLCHNTSVWGQWCIVNRFGYDTRLHPVFFIRNFFYKQQGFKNLQIRQSELWRLQNLKLSNTIHKYWVLHLSISIPFIFESTVIML